MLDRVFKRVSLIQMITLLMAVLGMLIDSIIIGQYLGVTAMGAYGLAAPILTLFSAIGGTIATGVQTACSKSLGAGDTKLANKQLSAAMFLGLIVSLIGTLLIIALARPIALGFGAGETKTLLQNTVDYLRGYIIGAPGLILVLIGLPFMQLDSDRNRAVVGAVLMTIADVVLDLVNVLVIHGGMFGMGLASAISVYVALVILLLHFVHKKYIFRLSFRNLEFKALPEIVSTGLPYAVTQICRTVMVITLNRLILSIGASEALAAYAVVNTMFNVLCIPGAAVGAATVMLTSIMNAERNRTGLESIVKIFWKYAIIYNVILAVLVWFLAPSIVGVFLKADQIVIDIATTGARFVGISMILAGINCGFRNYFQGIGKMKLTQFMCVGSTYIFLVLPAFILSHFMGMNGIWLSYIVADIIMLAIVFLIIGKKAGRIPRMKDMTYLDSDFGITPENLLEYNIHAIDDVMNASLEVSEFCKNHGANLQTRMMASLAVEEMGTNVMQHAYREKKNHFTIRVFYEGEKCTICLKDDCKAFDPKSYIEMHQSEDKTKNLGIRMIVGMADNIQYMNTFELNNLIISI